MVLGKFHVHVQKNEVKLLFNTTYKNQLKIGERPKLKTKIVKLLEETDKAKTAWHWVWQ
jgi:hypothetical protein